METRGSEAPAGDRAEHINPLNCMLEGLEGRGSGSRLQMLNCDTGTGSRRVIFNL